MQSRAIPGKTRQSLFTAGSTDKLLREARLEVLPWLGCGLVRFGKEHITMKKETSSAVSCCIKICSEFDRLQGSIVNIAILDEGTVAD